MGHDVLVGGTGIIGSFTALALHRRGLRVAVIDRNGLAPGTSRSSDGNLLCSDKTVGALLDLSQRSLELWRAFVDEYGNDCEFDPKGATVVARGAAQAAGLRAHVQAQRDVGIDCEFRDTDWQDLEPNLTAATSAVGHWPGDAQVQPMLACYQIARLLRAAGVDYRFYDDLATLSESAHGVTATLASGDRLQAGWLCLCTGVWTNEVLAPLGLSVPVQPRKGHIAVLERGAVVVNSKIADFAYNATAESTDTVASAVQTAAVIEATQSGTILCGSSREFAGFDRQPNSETLRRVVADCIGVVPALAHLRVIRGYAGLRPFSADGMPIIGPVSAHGRIVVATGHEGAGHGLAPVTGKLVADMVADGVTHPLDGVLHPERFAP